MKLYKQGDKSKAVCETCKDVISTTFDYRTVPFSEGSGEVKNILVAVCDACDAVIATPPQSTPAIKNARETATKSIEVKLPAPYLEILDLAAYRIDAMASTSFRKSLLTYYIHLHYGLIKTDNMPKRSIVKSYPKKVPTKRLSLKVAPRLYDEFEYIMDATDLKTTGMIKEIVQEIEKDIVRPKKPKHLVELQRLAMVTTA